MTITPQQVTNILQQVQDMRDAQRLYFQHRTEGNLKASIRKEQAVDSTLAHFIKSGVIKAKQPPAAPPKLFV